MQIIIGNTIGGQSTPSAKFLDIYGQGAIHAWSTVLLKSGVTDGTDLRRSSDQAEDTFGYAEGILDEAGIESFVGGQNLLLQSNQFDTTPWATSNTSVTGGKIGYDGSSDAWLLERTTANGFINQLNASSGVLCFSIYLKPGSYNWAFIRVQDSAGYRGVYFDLENGTTGGVDSGIIDYNIEAIGTNGWYRCSLALSNTLVRVLIYPSSTNGGASLSGTGSIYIQDAQLEEGSVATTYNPTTVGVGGNGFNKTLYDQVGNLDLTQGTDTRQPQLVSAGEMNKINGVPFMSNVALGGLLSSVSMTEIDGAATWSVDMDINITDTTTRQTIWSNNINSIRTGDRVGVTIYGNRLYVERFDNSTYTGDRINISSLSGRHKLTIVWSGNTCSAVYVDGSEVARDGSLVGWLGSTSNDTFTVFDVRAISSATYPFLGEISTLIFYDEAKDLAHHQAFNSITV